MAQRIPETPCEEIVASAAPLTPILKTIINVRSKTIFNTAEIKRKINGVVESPTALKFEESRLYSKVHGIPRNIINR